MDSLAGVPESYTSTALPSKLILLNETSSNSIIDKPLRVCCSVALRCAKNDGQIAQILPENPDFEPIVVDLKR